MTRRKNSTFHQILQQSARQLPSFCSGKRRDVGNQKQQWQSVTIPLYHHQICWGLYHQGNVMWLLKIYFCTEQLPFLMPDQQYQSTECRPHIYFMVLIISNDNITNLNVVSTKLDSCWSKTTAACCDYDVSSAFCLARSSYDLVWWFPFCRQQTVYSTDCQTCQQPHSMLT